jgi:CheY-like chemotaxis protein
MPRDGADALRILVVEDDSIIGFLLSEMLGDLGHEVCGIERTENGAVAAALRMKPDIMLVDANLAAGTGAGAMARVLRTGPVPYVMMSGLPMAGSAYGAVSLLKPFSQDALMRAIADSIACHQQAFSTLHNDLSRALSHDD